MRLEATNKNVRGGLNKPPPLTGRVNVYPTFMDHYMNKENISINNSKFYCQLNLRALKGLIDLNFF